VVFVLGSLGGYDQSATSGYLFAKYGDVNTDCSSELGGDAILNYVVLDAGTVSYGLRSVVKNGSFFFDNEYTDNGHAYLDGMGRCVCVCVYVSLLLGVYVFFLRVVCSYLCKGVLTQLILSHILSMYLSPGTFTYVCLSLMYSLRCYRSVE
jgi:hypothetical protein